MQLLHFSSDYSSPLVAPGRPGNVCGPRRPVFLLRTARPSLAARRVPRRRSLWPQLRPPTLTWNYTPAAPERFVVRRSLMGNLQDVAILPGASGTGLTWEDTTLPVSTGPMQARYTVYSVVGTGAQSVWSEASNVAVTTVGFS